MCILWFLRQEFQKAEKLDFLACQLTGIFCLKCWTKQAISFFFFMKPMEIRIHQFSFPYSFPLKPSFSTTQTNYNDCIYYIISEAPNISSHFPKHITKKEQHYWKKKPLIMFNRIIIQIHPQLILTSYFLFLIRI